MNNSKKITAARAILAAACIALGVVLIVHPGFTGIVICRTAGALALAFGAARVFSALRERDLMGWVRLDLVVGILLLAFGVFALVQPEAILSILPIVLGIYLLVECLGKTQRALVGALLIVNPFQAAETMLMFLGASMVLDGAADLWVLWCFAAHSPD